MPTITARTRDGLRIEGRTNAELIDRLRQHSWTPGPTLRGYMLQTAAAAETQTGHHVRGDTADELVADLVQAGLLTLLIDDTDTTSSDEHSSDGATQ